MPHSPDRTRAAIPSQTATLAGVMAALQLAISVAVWQLPNGAEAFNLPKNALLALSAGAALALVGLALAAWRWPQLPALAAGWRWLESIRASRWAWPVTLLLAGVAVLVSLRVTWIGNTLAGVQVMVAASIAGGAAINRQATVHNQRRWLALCAGLALVVGLGLRVWMLRMDWIWIDEGFHLSAAANMLKGGGISPAMMRFPADTPLAPWRGAAFAIYGLWARWFGLGLAQARWLSYLIGLLALPPFYVATRLWYGPRSAAASSGLFALSFLFIQSTNGRTDTLPMLAVSLTLCAHVYATKSGRLWAHALTGALAALALETHFVALIFFATWGGAYGLDTLRRWRASEGWRATAALWAFVGGLLPLLAIYVYLHVLSLPHPSGAFSSIGAGLPTEGLLTWRLQIAWQRGVVYWHNAPLEVLLLGITFAAAIVRRTQADRHWLALVAFTALGYVAAESNGGLHHTLYALPLLMAPTGALVTHGFGQTDSHEPAADWALLAAGGLLLVAFAVGTIDNHAQDRLALDKQYGVIADAIRADFPPDTAIIGPPIYYAYLPEYETYLVSRFPSVARGPELAGADMEAYWRDQLLQTWPRLRITDPQPAYDRLAVFASYAAALGMQEMTPGLWAVKDGYWALDANLHTAACSTPLRLVGYHLPDDIEPGQPFTLSLLWTTCAAPDADYTLHMAIDSTAYTLSLTSNWTGTPTSEWAAYSFHATEVELTVPEGISTGEIELSVESVCAGAEGNDCISDLPLSLDSLRVDGTSN